MHLTNFGKKQTRRLVVCACALALLLMASPNLVVRGAQNTDRDRAFQLLREGKFADAQQILEKLAVEKPSDGDVQFGLGFAILATSTNIQEEAARRQARVRSRNLLLRAKELGVQDDYKDLLESSLASIAPDGGEMTKFSNSAEAEKAMREGEAAFTREEYDKAIEAYQRALTLDPKLYLAAVFLGDMYFQKKQIDKAGEWYGRAIAIDPNRETAHRYWSDVLLKNGQMNESRAQAIEAIIAEPYNRTAYNGLVQWAKMNKVSINHPKIDQPPSSMRSSTDNNQTTITIDPKTFPKEGAPHYWAFYDLTRSAYPAKFKSEFPNEQTYRHSLKEEAAALRVVAEMLANDLKSGKLKTVDDESLANLLKLYQADMIEPYVLFARADAGISKDYEGYRTTNREKLKRYWSEVVIAGK